MQKMPLAESAFQGAGRLESACARDVLTADVRLQTQIRKIFGKRGLTRIKNGQYFRTQTDMDHVFPTSIFFIITTNGLWKACLICGLFSKMHHYNKNESCKTYKMNKN